MKGHMEDGKFHPHTQTKGVRKSRDQSTKTKGILVERKAREVIFQDDPDAIPKLEKKLEDLEKQKAYWKTVKKTVPRDYSATEGDRKWFMPQLINTNIRTVKKKIEKIKDRTEKGIGLERKTTFKGGKKVFYYEEVQPVGKVRKERNEAGNEEFELTDILENVTASNNPDDLEVSFPVLEKVMKENIQEILEREKIWKEGDFVSFPVGGFQHLREETSKEEFERTGRGDSGFYHYDFDLINSNNDITYNGTSFGDISAGTMTDMTIEVKDVAE